MVDISKAFLPFSYPLTTFFFLLFPSLSHSFQFFILSPLFFLFLPSFYLPSFLPVCLLFLLSIFILKPSTFLPITSLFSMFFFSFLHSLASSLIFLLTLYIFPTHIHRLNHSKVKGMVTVLWGSEGMER